ncbi:MAG TPA: ATP synthase F1 subunit delta [Terriglobales bacterium]|jgi:F-type H+-transporting ATPase subunit delta|nr:ATP synthase F1 subunit delta [Terriglobales bacterium]
MATVINTYARAFADVVFDSHLDVAQTLKEAQALAELVAANKQLRDVWATPSIRAEQKRAVLDAIVKREGISRPVRNFVAVLMDHHRISFLAAIVKQFELELDAHMGFAEAQITSARELGEGERAALESQVQILVGKKVRARYFRDASLLGGAVVRVGSTIYDGSVEGQLERIREAIST